jgi:hypothetical protein
MHVALEGSSLLLNFVVLDMDFCETKIELLIEKKQIYK